MTELTIISHQAPGMISIGNFDEIKEMLAERLSLYRNLVYSENALKEAKKDKSTLTKLKKAIDEKRKEIKKAYMQPYEAIEAQLKELMAMIDEPLLIIGQFVAQEQELLKEQKKAEIKEYYDRQASSLGEFSETLWNSPSFFDKSWTNASTSVKTYQSEVSARLQVVKQDIATIQAVGGAHTPTLLNKYLQTLSMDGLSDYMKALENVAPVAKADIPAETTQNRAGEEDNVLGYKILKLTATESQMLQILDQMELLGIDVEEIEDGMPQPMTELLTPDFNSFVVFDIETTGSFGASHGDQGAEITEIGAVKVVDGQIVERFSELVNPKRQIVPRIARLTHITNEMVADKPPIEDVIRKFKDFVGDSILVGHNIKSCDLPYIVRAAKRAGIAFENKYFDTYRYAKQLQAAHGWKNVRLETLSAAFGITQPDTHRAWCDAEANVGVYFALKDNV